MTIKFIIPSHDDRLAPTRGSDDAAGWDLRANEWVTIPPETTAIIPTGVHVVMPRGVAGKIHTRSGHAAKYDVSVLNSPGLIDSDYQGELNVILRNHSKDHFHIDRHDRIAQIVFEHVIMDDIGIDYHLPVQATGRGTGGLGSTGVK